MSSTGENSGRRFKIGTTTFGFRYLLAERERAPSLIEIVDRARSYGLDCLQVCENARPLELSPGEWRTVVRHASDAGLELQAGCLTVNPETLLRYLDLAAAVPSPALRVVLEEHGQGRPTRECVEAFLEAVVPRLQAAGMRLAIENHFDIPCRVVAELASRYPADVVGFCIDTANSLRNFEAPEQVLELLGPRVVCYHLKDYRVLGSNVGFAVAGAPLGEGDLDLSAFLPRALGRYPAPHLFIENWVGSTGDRDADIASDEAWLLKGLDALRRALSRV